MNTTRIFKWTFGTLLAATALTLVAPAAEARLPIDYESMQGNELVAVRSVAHCRPNRHDPSDFAVSYAIQVLSTRVGAREEEFLLFGINARVHGQQDYAHVDRYLAFNGEWAVPPVDPGYPSRERTYAGQNRFSQSAGGTTVAVGADTYGLDVRATVELDYAFRGRAYSVSDTALAGQLDTRMRLDFVMELPDDIMIEDGREIGRSLTERKVQGPPAHFASRLSCDLSTRDPFLKGSWSRMQQTAWALRLRLLRESRLGTLTGTSVLPLMDRDFHAVDEYIFDRRAKP